LDTPSYFRENKSETFMQKTLGAFGVEWFVRCVEKGEKKFRGRIIILARTLHRAVVWKPLVKHGLKFRVGGV
jgi:hypothetical protein